MYFGLTELRKKDVGLVGGKSSSLGELTSLLLRFQYLYENCATTGTRLPILYGDKQV